MDRNPDISEKVMFKLKFKDQKELVVQCVKKNVLDT